MNKGSLVRFEGADKDQIAWGANDDPNKVLEIGETYVVSDVSVHSFHTKISIEGVKGRFNSVSFTEIDKQ